MLFSKEVFNTGERLCCPTWRRPVLLPATPEEEILARLMDQLTQLSSQELSESGSRSQGL